MMHATKLDLVFSALGDATRRDILARLVKMDLSVGELAENYDMSLPAVSKHIAILESAGLLTIVKQGRHKLASIAFETFRPAQIWMESFDDEASFWDQLEKQIDDIG